MFDKKTHTCREYTYRDFTNKWEIAMSAARRHVQFLEKKGIVRIDKTTRSQKITILKDVEIDGLEELLKKYKVAKIAKMTKITTSEVRLHMLLTGLTEIHKNKPKTQGDKEYERNKIGEK